MILMFLAWMISNVAVAILLMLAFKRSSIALICTSVFIIVQFQVRPLLFLLRLNDPFPANLFGAERWELVTMASITSTVWTSLLIAFYWFFRKRATLLVPIFPQAPKVLDKHLLLIGSFFSTAVSTVATVSLVLQYRSIAAFTFAAKAKKELAGYYSLREIAIVAALVAFFTILVYVRKVKLPNGRIKATVPSAILISQAVLIVLNLALNFLWGNRFNVGAFLFVAGICWHFYVRRFRMVEILGYGAAAMAGLAFLRNVRWLLFSEAVDRNVSSRFDFWLDLSASLHFAEFDALMLALRDTGRRFDFRLGQDFINGFLSWLPRSILPDKEGYNVGQWFRQVYDSDKVNGWPVTIAGDWYVNFGWIGVVLGAMLSGYLVATVDNAYPNPRRNAWHAVLAGAFGTFVLTGGFGTGAPQGALTVLVPFAIITFLLRNVGGGNRVRTKTRNYGYTPIGSSAGR